MVPRNGLGLGLGFNRGGGDAKYSTEAITYFNALVNKPDDTDAQTVNTFIETLKANGIWELLDDVKLLANWDTTGNIDVNNSTCLFNMVNPTKYKGSPVNTPTTIKYTGIYGGGTSCIDTNFNMATAGVKSSQNDVMHIVAIKSTFSEINKIQAGGDLSYGLLVARNYTGFAGRSNDTFRVLGAAQTNPCILGVVRGGSITSGKIKGYIDGSASATGEVVSPSYPIENISYALLALKLAITPTYSFHCKDTLSLHIVGRALPSPTDDKYLVLYNAMNTMLNSLYARA